MVNLYKGNYIRGNAFNKSITINVTLLLSLSRHLHTHENRGDMREVLTVPYSTMLLYNLSLPRSAGRGLRWQSMAFPMLFSA